MENIEKEAIVKEGNTQRTMKIYGRINARFGDWKNGVQRQRCDADTGKGRQNKTVCTENITEIKIITVRKCTNNLRPKRKS